MTELPDLRRVGIVAIDTETLDRGLQADRGSSWPWRDGHICGVSVAWRADGVVRSQYVSLRHPDSDNHDATQVYRWLGGLFASPTRIVTQNGIYDYGWLGAESGLATPPSERIEEIGALAATIDENRRDYSLDALCKSYGLPGKDDAILRQAIEAAGFAPKRKKLVTQNYLWRLPARYVSSYAEGDAIATLALFEKLDPILDREKTRDAYRLDCDLVPIAIAMRAGGIRIDQNAAEQARDLLLKKRNAALAELSSQLRVAVSMAELNSPKWKAAAFDTRKIAYPKTPLGNPSFAAGKTGWMAKHQHWLPQLIATANKYEAAGTKFLEGHILGHIVGGRIHAEIRPLKAEDGGTRSSRFSYSSPPLQQMPTHDPEIGPLIRGVFLPEEGEVWAKPDLSQQEFRWTVHYAAELGLRGAEEAAKVFPDDPNADFHAMVAAMTELPRSSAKSVNFARIHGAGVKRLAEMIGKPLAETQAIIAQYDQKLPFMSALSALCQERAHRIGYTVLYDGARRHWNLFEVPRLYIKGAGPCRIEEARARVEDPDHPWHGQRIRRANVYTALNALIQGTSARHTKLWMRAIWREGVTPLLQMHDCLDCSVKTPEQAEMVARLGCEIIAAKVPMQVDLKFGRSWGDASHSWEELAGDRTCSWGELAGDRTHHNGAKAEKVVPVQSTIAIPAPPENEIDLADLIDQPVPRSRKIECPFHTERTASMHIYRDHYYCFGCGAHGDRIGWLTYVEGLDYAEARHIVANWDGPRSQKQDDAAPAHLEAALQLWGEARGIVGTLAARYLSQTCNIDLAVLPDDIGERALRFLDNCPFGRGVRHPCLIVLMRSPAGDAPCGIHRIALSAEARKIGRRMFGAAGIAQLYSPAGNWRSAKGSRRRSPQPPGSLIAASRCGLPGRRCRRPGSYGSR